MTQPELHELAGAYALDALGDDERRRFEHHLTECEPCRRRTVELQEAAAVLATAVAVTPPPALEQALLTAVVDVPQEHDPEPARIDARRRRPTRERAYAAVAVLVLVASGLGVVLGVQRWVASRSTTSR